jgi:hypothetical protein
VGPRLETAASRYEQQRRAASEALPGAGCEDSEGGRVALLGQKAGTGGLSFFEFEESGEDCE